MASFDVRRFFVYDILKKKRKGAFPFRERRKFMKESFILYQRYKSQFELLTMEQRGILITAIFNHASGEAVPEITDVPVKMAFSFISEQLDYDRGEYEKKCKKNAENATKRWDKKSDANVCDRISDDANVCDSMPKDANRCLYESESDSDSESVSDSVSDICGKNPPKKKGTKRFPHKKVGNSASYQQASVDNSKVDDSDDYENNEYFEAALARSRRFLRDIRNSSTTPPSSA